MINEYEYCTNDVGGKIDMINDKKKETVVPISCIIVLEFL
jgi:hypothetical protein